MNKKDFSKDDVIRSNEVFYDKIASVYEKVDSRRNSGLDFQWLKSINKAIRNQLDEKFPGTKHVFVDAGAGSGFLAENAKEYFSDITLIDLSKAMLDRIDIPGARKIQGDCSRMPLEPDSVHYVGAFATLHHLFDPEEFFREAYRVLATGGILYTDHDIEKSFVSIFKLPLLIFRFFYDHGPKYIHACPESKMEDYEISEFHGGTGLSGKVIVGQLKSIGFSKIRVEYHWDGGGMPEKIVTKLALRSLMSRRGLAPNLRIIAEK